MKSRSLIINGVFSNAVGHLIEALAVANSFKQCNPTLAVTLLVDASAPLRLLNCLDQREICTIAVNTELFTDGADPRQGLCHIPRECTFLFTIRDERDVTWSNPGLKRFHTVFREWIKARYVTCLGEPLQPHMPHCALTQLMLKIPQADVNWANTFVSHRRSPRIVILTGSATFQKAPTVNFWSALIRALIDVYPSAEIVLMGSLNDSRSPTQNISSADVNKLLTELPQCCSVFDQDILRQLAVAELSQVFIAPHSGMGFAIQCVGVPWLALSGGPVHEYFLNGIPFACVYPRCQRYPCNGQLPGHEMLEDCKTIISEGTKPLICLDEAEMMPRLDEIVGKVSDLISGRRSYVECLEAHISELKARGIASSLIIDNSSLVINSFL